MTTEKIRGSVGIRLIIITVLSLALLIPCLLIERLIHERETTRNSAVWEVSEKWGGSQLLAGPILTVPLKNSTRMIKAISQPQYNTHIFSLTSFQFREMCLCRFVVEAFMK